MKLALSLTFCALLLLTLVALLFSAGATAAPAAIPSVNLTPASYLTTSGGSGAQPVANLAVLDQTGTADDPAAYVSFTTPGVVYQGYRSYFLPPNILRSTVVAMSVSVNYKGAPSTTQLWTWSLYNWSTKRWVRLGDNARAGSQRWSLLVFKL